MTGTNPPRSIANGTARPKPAPRRPAPAPDVPGFIRMEPPAADAEMWPVHPVIWWQPQLTPVAPVSEGLRLKHRYKVPAPDFVSFEPAPAGGRAEPKPCGEPRVPEIARRIPACALAPQGWDPRVARKGGNS